MRGLSVLATKFIVTALAVMVVIFLVLLGRMRGITQIADIENDRMAIWLANIISSSPKCLAAEKKYPAKNIIMEEKIGSVNVKKCASIPCKKWVAEIKTLSGGSLGSFGEGDMENVQGAVFRLPVSLQDISGGRRPGLIEVRVANPTREESQNEDCFEAVWSNLIAIVPEETACEMSNLICCAKNEALAKEMGIDCTSIFLGYNSASFGGRKK